MKRPATWFTVLSIIGLFLWINWTSPTLNQCISDHYENYSSNAFKENVGSFYRLLVGSRLCLGEFIHSAGDGIIAIFTVILGIATWFLWRATRDLVNDARATSTKQLEVAKISAEATKAAAESIPTVERAWLFGGPSPEGVAASDSIMSFKVRIYNYGKTPGIVKEVWWDAVPDEPTALEAEYVDGHPHKLDVVIAGGEDVVINRLNLSAKSNEFLIGYVAYDDIFKRRHRSRFCLWIRTGPLRFETAGAPAWNDYD